MNEAQLRQQMADLGRILDRQGLCPGTSGNLSVKLGDDVLMSPTNSRLGLLRPGRISHLAADGHHIAGDKPSKEVVVHQALYQARPHVGAVVHLHAPWSMALACLDDLDPADVIPPLTPYYVMRIGKLPLVPYCRPGDPALAEAVGTKAAESHALLLAQHGLIAGGRDLVDAVANAEELEATARLFFLLKDRPHRRLSAAQIAALENVFPRRI
jgi:ribulose-5-phosphate 4-epimerase/fuculose-1-phosphate aldolase